ncbi:MAG: 50S ribosomal protein L1 [Deltaproteobacteria bacterium]|jgi:large subunit ribosomal protein L1|nr:50S ribosomal protein L1 [Deltaproteobacteria bacterium]
MSNHGKSYKVSREKVDSEKKYSLVEALGVLEGFAKAKFDETVDIAVRLGIDAKQTDQMVRASCSLPHGIGKKVKVVVFARGDKAKEAEDAGADVVGADDLAEKIRGGWLAFDKAIATPDMMGVVGQLGKVLGPRGLMPNPKLGTVTMDVKKAVTEQKAGKVEFRIEKASIVHAPVGKRSFGVDKLKDNILALVAAINKAKPSASKGTYLRSMAISATMTPGIRVDVGSL